MHDAAKSGRTILFVSHNLTAVQTLCRQCVLLERGQVKLFSADVAHVIDAYLHDAQAAAGGWWEAPGPEAGNRYFTPRAFGVVDGAGRPAAGPLDRRAEYWVSIAGEVAEPHPALTIGYALYAEDGTLLYWSYHTDAAGERPAPLPAGAVRLRSRFPDRLLNEGTYRLELIGGLHFIEWLFEPNTDVPRVQVELRGVPSLSPYWLERRPGLLAPRLEWTAE
jgi:lipopolysaccharide transport system ATP-binding protein